VGLNAADREFVITDFGAVITKCDTVPGFVASSGDAGLRDRKSADFPAVFPQERLAPQMGIKAQ
jgi:hypothetical protein